MRALALSTISHKAAWIDVRRAVLAVVISLIAAPAAAVTYTVDITGPLDIGAVSSASTGDTVFRITPSSGVVSVQSGSGRRIATGNVRALVNVGCRPAHPSEPNCRTDNVRIQIGTIGAVSGRARALNTFTVAMGTATLAVPPTGATVLSFSIGPIGANQTKSFYVGADFPVAANDSGLASGSGQNGFYVAAVDQFAAQLATDTDKGLVKAYRALAATKTTDLNFGTVQRPGTGSATVAINPANGQRTITGGAAGFPTPAPSAAAFFISGEGGQTFSLSIPPSVNLTGPGTLVAALVHNAVASPTLSAALGQGGVYAFGIGGSLPLTSTTPTGAYSGTFVVSLDYN